MHDELAGLLTAIKSDLTRLAESDADPASRIAGLVGLTDAAIKSSRRIINDLRPPALDQLGLWSAVEWLCSDLANRTGLQVIVDIAPVLEQLMLSPNTTISVYRIVQEALNNVVKHAAAKQAIVRAQRSGNDVVVEIADDGEGMDNWTF